MMELWMSLVGISMAVAGIPQIYRMWQRKSSGDVSLIFWLVLVHGIAWWLYYGISIGSTSLIITNSVCLMFDISTVIMIIKYRKEK